MRTETSLIVWHCSATKPDQDIGAADIDAMHKARGWSGIGYMLVIRRNGALEGGRSLDAVGAHVKGYNKVSVGVCMVGGLDDHGDPIEGGLYTQAQWNTADAVREMLLKAYPTAHHVGHRDLSPDIDGDGVIEEWEWLKQCPCFSVKGRWGSDG